MARRATRRKKKSIKLERARVHIHSTFNNTILTLTDPEGNVLTWKSPGTEGFSGSRKGTPYAAQVACQALVKEMKEFGIRSVVVTVNGAGPGRQAVIQTLKSSGIQVEEVKNVTPTPHS
ncbi:30S ribosomal protein S11 [Candidatus Bipolaricaulota bacterium]|nr:30S ribosomal protein S11 [Candidatus Bipolaricaulota bacterium]RLE31219.1 MAG: 30S ribosomal protein S11 [Candidatus Acetothermia bacterium]RLE33783.1 MAG: 30S ribosomal protein S11 [Candidatus Acetothermia bacterium]HDC92971.1 30S ribosomal protein S11 [Candidatus Acetothermia bacterium]